jgi:hypothetical protein
VAGAVHVAGPGNTSRDLTQSATFAGLAPGDYVVTASGVSLGAASYVPLPASQAVTVVAGATATASVSYAARAVPVGLAQVASGLDRPIFLAAPDGDARQFIALRGGRIVVLQGGQVLAQPFLDIGAGVATGGEGGLLAFAFDPQYAASGYFYVCYTDLQQNIVVERFHAQASSSQADPASGLVILRIPHPGYSNHYGGMLAFGPDGYLYISTGDGGGEYDPLGNGRNLGTLLGKLLRIDVSHATAAAPYAVPATNPYVGQPRMRPEIWEVDIADAATGGLDYGWSTMEGTMCVKDDCDRTGLTLPAFEYGHNSLPAGPCAIVGGYVYRGAALPELAGRYFYSDYCAGFLKSFYVTGGNVIEQREWAVPPVGQVVSFGRDGQGELYLVAASGNIYKIGRTFAPKS